MSIGEYYDKLPEGDVDWHGEKLKAKFLGYLDPRRKRIKKFVTRHHLWNGYLSIKDKTSITLTPPIGEWMYLYQNQSGIAVDLIELPNYFYNNQTLWESCSQGRYCEEPERFGSMEEAERIIKRRLLRDNKKRVG